MTSTVATDRPGRLTTRLVWAIAGIGLGLIGVVVWLGFSRSYGSSALAVLTGLGYVAALASFLLCGALILSRQPRNVVGWLLLIPGMTAVIAEVGNIWLASFDPPPAEADVWLWLVLWFVGWSWVLLIFPIFHLLLTLPGGPLLSDRWRWVVWLEGLMVATMIGLVTFGARLEFVVDEKVLWTVPNPVGLVSSGTDFFADGGLFDSVSIAGLLVLTVVSVTAFVLRFRRGSSDEREQLKWPLYGIAVFGLVYGSMTLQGGPAEDLADLVFGLSIAGIPISVAVAVLRYRLYEIDRIISRTVSYAVVIGLLVAVFFGVVTALSNLLPGDSQLVVASSTLAVAALFNPMRKRVQGWVDRRFNRTRYDTQRVADRFANALRDEVDPDRIMSGWLRVVAETMQPGLVGVWLGDPASSDWGDR